jgi:anaerobic selenocysteine-containing dehydrogenase
MMNAAEARELGFAEDDVVRVETETGALDNLRLRFLDVPRGSLVMYYPEANAILPRRIDPNSGTPAFKSAVATVAKSSARAPAPHHARHREEAPVQT